MTAAATAAATDTKTIGGIPFTVASRPQSRFSNTQQGISNFAAGGSFQIVQLPATGWVRKIMLLFSATYTTSASAALVAGDGPFNLITGVTVTDATGQPIQQPISGYNLRLVNKYFPSSVNMDNQANPYADPVFGSEYAFSASSTSGTATFRLEIDFEQDVNTGYGSIPNLDSNASLQLKVDYAIFSVAFTGGTGSAATIGMRVSQYYWAPVGKTLNGAPVDVSPPGAGDYVETRYETQTVTAAAENLVTFTNRGGMVKGFILVSRAAGTRTAPTAAANFGVLLDNQPIDEGIPIEEHYDVIRGVQGFGGAFFTTSYAPITAGTLPGLDTGVVPYYFGSLSGYRDSWLNTRVGSLLQVKFTPGASATTLEIIVQLAQVKDAPAFFARS
jgi:hypothetical protein